MKIPMDPEMNMRYKNIKSRKEYELLREADRLTGKFESTTSPIDPEMEKEIDRIIDDKIAQGYEDS